MPPLWPYFQGSQFKYTWICNTWECFHSNTTNHDPFVLCPDVFFTNSLSWGKSKSRKAYNWYICTIFRFIKLYDISYKQSIMCGIFKTLKNFEFTTYIAYWIFEMSKFPNFYLKLTSQYLSAMQSCIFKLVCLKFSILIKKIML